MAKDSTPGVVIKGTRDGVSILLGEGGWPPLLEELAERLHATASFFAGARVAVDVGERILTASELRELGEVLDRYDMGLHLILAESPQTRSAARVIDVRAVSGEPAAAGSATPPVDAGQREGILVRRTIRSGQAIQYPGHIVVIGDVNPGGEVIAGGDVVIWGRLRGIVHAGAMGDDSAVVCALQMRPMQLRIGNHIARAPEEQGKQPMSPEIALVREGGIVAEPWNEGTSEV